MSITKHIIIFMGLLVIMTSISVYAIEEQSDTTTSVYELSKLINEQTSVSEIHHYSQNELIYAKGNNIEITQKEISMYTKRYIIMGYNENAEQCAYNDLVKRKALYQKAIDLGYYVDDAELDKIIEDNKREMSDPQFKDFMDAIYEGFGGEDNYWDYIREITRVTATSSKYLNDKEKQYRQENGDNCYVVDDETGVIMDNWDIVKEEIINDIVFKEEMQVIDE